MLIYSYRYVAGMLILGLGLGLGSVALSLALHVSGLGLLALALTPLALLTSLVCRYFLPRETAMQTQSRDRNSVCLSVRPSVCHTHAL